MNTNPQDNFQQQYSENVDPRCRYTNPITTLAAQGRLLELYSEPDYSVPPVAYPSKTITRPAQTLTGTGTGECTVSITGTLSAVTETETTDVYPIKRLAVILTAEGRILYGVDVSTITVMASKN